MCWSWGELILASGPTPSFWPSAPGRCCPLLQQPKPGHTCRVSESELAKLSITFTVDPEQNHLFMGRALHFLHSASFERWVNRFYLFMPLQQDGATVFRGPLKALVDVLHQQVHAAPVQGLNRLLDVAALEGTEHLQDQHLCTFLPQREQGAKSSACISDPLGKCPTRRPEPTFTFWFLVLIGGFFRTACRASFRFPVQGGLRMV